MGLIPSMVGDLLLLIKRKITNVLTLALNRIVLYLVNTFITDGASL